MPEEVNLFMNACIECLIFSGLNSIASSTLVLCKWPHSFLCCCFIYNKGTHTSLCSCFIYFFDKVATRDEHLPCFGASAQIRPIGVAQAPWILCPASSHSLPIRNSTMGFPAPSPCPSGHLWEEVEYGLCVAHVTPVGSICRTALNCTLPKCPSLAATSGLIFKN